MRWESFLAPKRIKPYFEKVLRSGHLHHAYIFSGPPQVGKKTFARLLAQEANCLKPGSDGEHSCVQCQKIENGNHPDVRFIAPEGAYIKIGQIRQVIADANLKPLEGKRKVYVITSADQLKTEAANALLKTLEEPSSRSLFLLTTSKPASLLPTIISRCLIITFNRLGVDEITGYLMENKGVPNNTALEITPLADGRIGRALDLISQDKKMERAELVSLFSRLLDSSSFLAYYELIDQLLRGSKAEVIERLHLFSGWLRDLIMLEKGLKVKLNNSDQKKNLRKLMGRFPVEALKELIYRVNDFCQLIPVNLNQTLYWENSFSKLYRSARGDF